MPRLQSLHPGRIKSSDFIDVSNLQKARLLIRTNPTSVRYGSAHADHNTDDIPFPSNSRGFFYYHHDTSFPPTTAEIRFRLTPDDDPANFENGEDLIGRYGGPWSISLFKMTKPSYEPFKTQIVEEGLVDPSLMRTVQEGWTKCRGLQAPSLGLHYLEQPFAFNINTVLYLRIFTPHTIGFIRIKSMFMDYRGGIVTSVYTGRVLLRFERSTLPEHTGSNFLVMRVLEILEPIKVVIPGYDMRLPVPKEGSLVTTYNRRGILRAYAINLDQPSKLVKDLNLLARPS